MVELKIVMHHCLLGGGPKENPRNKADFLLDVIKSLQKMAIG